MRTAYLGALVAITGAWVALGGTIAWVATSDGDRAAVATSTEIDPETDPETDPGSGPGGPSGSGETDRVAAPGEQDAEEPESSAEAALEAAGCEHASAKGAVCRFVVAIEERDPTVLPEDDRETYDAKASWLEERSSYTWEPSDDCVLEGDVTIVCSSTATPPDSTDFEIIDFTVQPVGDNLEHHDGATAGIDDYAVIALTEFHQE